MTRYLSFLLLTAFFSVSCYSQVGYPILMDDTTIAAGESISLCIDSVKAYSNFIFSAKDPKTKHWTIWHKNQSSGKYEPMFTDGYNRLNPVVAADLTEIIYVRYRPQKEENMHNGTLDSAWICRSSMNGSHESIIFTVPIFNKSAVYDLDWNPGKDRILYAYGNDEFPSLSRDGDVFEYNLNTGSHTNLTNNWDYMSRYCKHGRNNSFAYSQNANPWYPGNTDIFLRKSDGTLQQMTDSAGYINEYKYCTLTDMKGETILYRRGQFGSNKLYCRTDSKEKMIFNKPGYGGIILDNNLYAATDFDNNIYIFTDHEVLSVSHVSSVSTFSNDNYYTYPQDFNTHLNFAGRPNVKVRWSTGDTGFSVRVCPPSNTTYYCTVTAGGITYKDSIHIQLTGRRPVITRSCLTLSVGTFKRYQWLLNGNRIAGAVDSTFTPVEAGVYSVLVTDINGRTVPSLDMGIDMSSADSLRTLNNAIRIEPDPATSIVHILSPIPLNIAVTNETGKVVYEKNDTQEFDMNNLPDGIYSIMVFDNNCLKMKSRRILKKND